MSCKVIGCKVKGMLPLERLRKSNTTENLWLYILSFLKKQPIYGYEIPALIKREFNFKPGKITPYRVLYRLETQKFVKSKMKERKKVYTITKKGEEELEEAKKFYQETIKKLER